MNLILEERMQVIKPKETKTYKREMAAILFFFMIYLGVMEQDNTLEIVIWPIFLFGGAAFGMEWASKQTDLIQGAKKDGKG